MTSGPPNVWMLDQWCIVPYYDAHLCEAMLKTKVPVRLISSTYYLDRQCFVRHGIIPDPGLIDFVARFNFGKLVRRLLKIFEVSINTVAITLKALRSRPDVLHVQYLPLLKWDVPVDLWLIRYFNWLNIPVVYTVHDLLPHDTGQTHRAIFQRLYDSVQGLICHSDETRRRLQQEFGVPNERIRVIPHGPFFTEKPATAHDELRNRLGLAPRDEVVLWQGLIFPYKGIDFLLASWRLIQARRSNAKLFIAGTGDEGTVSEIRTLVKQYGIEESVRMDIRFLPISEMLQLYSLALLVVYPYRAVTSSGALLTGLSQGKAIVATRLPPFEELLEDGKTAILVDYGDVGGLAEAIIELLENESLRKGLENAVSLKFGPGDWEQIAKKTAEYYTAVRNDGQLKVSHNNAPDRRSSCM